VVAVVALGQLTEALLVELEQVVVEMAQTHQALLFPLLEPLILVVVAVVATIVAIPLTDLRQQAVLEL
jgi:hypothetical protein